MRVLRAGVVVVDEKRLDTQSTTSIDLPSDDAIQLANSPIHAALRNELRAFAQLCIAAIAQQTGMGDTLVGIDFNTIECTLLIRDDVAPTSINPQLSIER